MIPQCLLGGGTACIPYILLLLRTPRAANAMAGLRHMGLPKENRTGGLFWIIY